MSFVKGLAFRFELSGKLAAGWRVWAARGEWNEAAQMIEIDTEAEMDEGPYMEIVGIFTAADFFVNAYEFSKPVSRCQWLIF